MLSTTVASVPMPISSRSIQTCRRTPVFRLSGHVGRRSRPSTRYQFHSYSIRILNAFETLNRPLKSRVPTLRCILMNAAPHVRHRHGLQVWREQASLRCSTRLGFEVHVNCSQKATTSDDSRAFCGWAGPLSESGMAGQNTGTALATVTALRARSGAIY